jgi:hypothetical protein
MKALHRIILSFALVMLTVGTIFTKPARAAGTVTVTNANDSGSGSLRDALTNAAAGDAIVFDASLSGATIRLASTLTLSKNVTIDGTALATPITISGDTDNDAAGDVQVFIVNTGVTATLNGLVITKGYIFGSEGGGIANSGSLTVTNCTFIANEASDFGGAIVNIGMLAVTNSVFNGNTSNTGGAIENYSSSGSAGLVTISNSVFTGNTANFNGGAILNENEMTIINSVFSGNGSDDGGAIENYQATLTIKTSTFNINTGVNGGAIKNTGGTVTISNSTLYANTASSWGGGIENNGALNITNVTISHNSAAAGKGGGIDNYSSATLNMVNTIVANSPTGGDCINTATLGANTSNLVEDGSCSPSFTGDPKLGPLTGNGGSTQTMSLLAGSPALDSASDTACASDPINNLDQRGIARPQGTHCDIGAFEYKAPTTLTLNVKSDGAQDGWTLESGENTNVGGSVNASATTLRLGDDAAKKQVRAVLSFDTSNLPDNAVITKVTLKVKQQGISGGGAPVTDFQGFMVDIRKGAFGLPALQAGDFQAAVSKTYGPFSPTLASGWYSFNLTNAKAYVNKLAANNGLTQIRLRFKLSDNNNAIANYLSLFSGNAGAAARPQLIVEYYVP